MFSLYSRSRLHSFGEIDPALALLVAVAARDVLHRLGLRRAQPALDPLAAPPGRRGLQRLVHVPDPAPGARGDRPLAAALHQVGRLRVRPARQGGRLPDGDLPRRRGLARAVDRQERRPRLAGLLPPAQPVHRGAAALAVPPRRPDGPGEPQPPDQAPGLDAVLHRRAAPPGPARTCSPARTGCTRSWRPSSPRSTRCASSSPTPSSSSDPDAFPPARTKPPRKGTDGTEVPSRRAQLIAPALAPLRQLRKPRELAGEFPEAEIAAHGRQVVPPGRATTRAIVSMPDGTSAALYTRDPEQFRDLLKRTLEIHLRLYREWPRARRGVPRQAARDHLARGVGGDLPAVDRSRGGR